MSRKYTKELLLLLIPECQTMAEVCRKLNIKPATGSQSLLSKRVKEYEIDISHFLGQGHGRGKIFGPKRKLEDYLNNLFFIKSDALRRRLIKEGIKNHQCEICLLTKWNNEQIPLELDHIDGNHNNNNLKNLRILCPNCHALTETYCGKNITNKPKKLFYCECGNIKLRESINCRECSIILRKGKTKLIYPDIDELLKKLETKSFFQLSKELGMSSKSIKNFVRKNQKLNLEKGAVA